MAILGRSRLRRPLLSTHNEWSSLRCHNLRGLSFLPVDPFPLFKLPRTPRALAHWEAGFSHRAAVPSIEFYLAAARYCLPSESHRTIHSWMNRSLPLVRTTSIVWSSSLCRMKASPTFSPSTK